MLKLETIGINYLDHLINKSQFARLATSIGEYTRLTGRERSFFIYKPLEEESVLTLNSNGETVFYDGDEDKITLDGMPITLSGGSGNTIEYSFSYVHSHPQANVYPSISDVKVLAKHRKSIEDHTRIRVRPLWAIVSPLHDHGDFSLFLYQENTDESLDSTTIDTAMEEIYKKIADDNDFQPLLVNGKKYHALRSDKHFESSGLYNATLVGFSIHSGLNVSREELAKYTHNPK